MISIRIIFNWQLDFHLRVQMNDPFSAWKFQASMDQAICPGHQHELGQTENSNPRSSPVPKLRKSRTKRSVPWIRRSNLDLIRAVFLLLSGKTTVKWWNVQKRLIRYTCKILMQKHNNLPPAFIFPLDKIINRLVNAFSWFYEVHGWNRIHGWASLWHRSIASNPRANVGELNVKVFIIKWSQIVWIVKLLIFTRYRMLSGPRNYFRN